MPELITMKEAQRRAGMAKNTLRKFIHQRGIAVYDNPRDGREKLVDAGELDAALQPRRITPDPEGKAAA